MPGSTKGVLGRERFWRVGACLLVLSLAISGSAAAEDGTFRIFASTLNKFAAALQPLTTTRTWSFTLWIPVPNPLLLGIPTPAPVPFTCDATASVTGINFSITPGSAFVSGNVNGTVCGVPYHSVVSTPVVITVDSSTRVLMVHPAGPMFVNATVSFLGFNIAAPFNGVNVAPLLSGGIALGSVPFEIETPTAPRTLILVTRNPQLSLQNGYVEVKVDALFR